MHMYSAAVATVALKKLFQKNAKTKLIGDWLIRRPRHLSNETRKRELKADFHNVQDKHP